LGHAKQYDHAISLWQPRNGQVRSNAATIKAGQGTTDPNAALSAAGQMTVGMRVRKDNSLQYNHQMLAILRILFSQMYQGKEVFHYRIVTR